VLELSEVVLSGTAAAVVDVKLGDNKTLQARDYLHFDGEKLKQEYGSFFCLNDFGTHRQT
jgi:hypothetical protein